MGQTGDNIDAKNANWMFSGKMVKSFEKHLKRSVPYYEEGHDLVLKLSDFFVKEDSVCYELGSATGILSHRLAAYHEAKSEARFIGLEQEPDMVTYAKKHYQHSQLNYLEENVLLHDYQTSDMIVSYYLVQFIRPSQRQQLINLMYQNLNWGGAFILFEKVRANDARFQDMMTTLYTDYKLEQGYSPEEIIQKNRSLKGVLEPFSSQANLDMLKRAGFVDTLSVMKHLCFEGILAIK